MHHSLTSPNQYAVTVGAPDDVKELVALIGASQMKYDGVVTATESFFGMLLKDPQVDSTLDYLQIQSSSTGELVGFGRYSNRPPHVQSRTQGFVHPEHEGQGIGTTIIEWGLQRSSDVLELAPPGTRVTNVCDVSDTNQAAAVLCEDNGFESTRYYLEMERKLDTPVSVKELPDGVTVRTFAGPEDIELIADPVNEAFRDHYGFTDSGHEDQVEQWHRYRGTDEWDDDLVWIVEADGEVVAVNASIKSLGARTDTGYVASLSVERRWRGMGIAKALLTMAFAEFQHRGTPIVALHVDADSLTGATKLYESVGMTAARTDVEYSHEVRPGKDLVVK